MSVLLYALVIWCSIIVLNVIAALITKPTEYDKIYSNLGYSAEMVSNRIRLLESLIGKELKGLRRRFNFFRKNAVQSRRNFKHYAKYLEPAMIEILTSSEGGHWNYFWRNSNTLTKLHFFYVLLVPCFLFILLFFSFQEEIPEAYLFALPGIVLAVVAIAAYILIINAFVYNYIVWFMNLFGYESLLYNKYSLAFSSATTSFKFYRRSAVILGASGVLMTSLGKLVKFKGFGGGKFGGGGASGSW